MPTKKHWQFGSNDTIVSDTRLVGNTRERLMTIRLIGTRGGACHSGTAAVVGQPEHRARQIEVYNNTKRCMRRVERDATGELSRGGQKRGRQDNYGWYLPTMPMVVLAHSTCPGWYLPTAQAVGITFTWSDYLHLRIVQPPPASFSVAT